MDSDSALAWAAGLFEGEGSFTLNRGLRPVAQLAMTDEDTVRRFHRIVGVGNVHGPYEGRAGLGSNSKPQWQWAAAALEDVRGLIGSFYPWLSARRQARASEIIAAADSRPVVVRDRDPKTGRYL